MLSMPFAASSRTLRSTAFGLLAALVTAVTPALASADTGVPSPQGYTGAVTGSPQDTADQYADNDPSALTDFRDTLDPHGTWVKDPTYGTVWVPNAAEVGSDFAPYQTSGRWAMADTGDWAWESDYAWGHVPFHYGRWVWTGGYWGWIPGRTYAPAWVTWRVGEDGYIGWAPLPPSWYWSDGYAMALWSVPYAAYCFVPTSYVFYPGVSGYVIRDRGGVGRAAAGTRPYHGAHPGTHGGYGGHRPASPTIAAAHIPQHAVPQHRVRADARAMSYATRSATLANHRGAAATGAQSHNYGSPAHNSWNRGAAPRGGANAWHNSYGGARSAQPSYPQGGQRAAHSSTPPTYHSASPASRTAPPTHYTPQPTHHASPTMHTPTTQSSTQSRPAARSSGGGSRSGGGGRRR
jgi:hypothetical protein